MTTLTTMYRLCENWQDKLDPAEFDRRMDARRRARYNRPNLWARGTTALGALIFGLVVIQIVWGVMR